MRLELITITALALHIFGAWLCHALGQMYPEGRARRAAKVGYYVNLGLIAMNLGFLVSDVWGSLQELSLIHI